ncbi:hypothetical protein BGLA2_1220017 [Burkholderia gladioli]|nr:hypothetical protein BGLA2_1220017 [Burkholderia gladioli]
MGTHVTCARNETSGYVSQQAYAKPNSRPPPGRLLRSLMGPARSGSPPFPQQLSRSDG